MCGFATMKASGRQEFVIQTKANDTQCTLSSVRRAHSAHQRAAAGRTFSAFEYTTS